MLDTAAGIFMSIVLHLILRTILGDAMVPIFFFSDETSTSCNIILDFSQKVLC